MKQYEYQLTNKTTGRAEFARATAATADIAWSQIVLAYGRTFKVADLFCDVNPAHHICGEIDCSDFPMSDLAWLSREVAKIVAR